MYTSSDSDCNTGVRFNAVLGVSFDDTGITEPCTLDEAKNWMRVDGTDDDSIITELITVARIMCEQYANISFVSRVVTASVNNSLGGITLPYGPIGDVSASVDIDGTDTEVTLKGQLFKFIQYPQSNYIELTYTAGYATLPKNLKDAVLNQVAYLYQNRGDSKLQSQLSPDAKGVLNLVKR